LDTHAPLQQSVLATQGAVAAEHVVTEDAHVLLVVSHAPEQHCDPYVQRLPNGTHETVPPLSPFVAPSPVEAPSAADPSLPLDPPSNPDPSSPDWPSPPAPSGSVASAPVVPSSPSLPEPSTAASGPPSPDMSLAPELPQPATVSDSMHIKPRKRPFMIIRLSNERARQRLNGQLSIEPEKSGRTSG
jgi:hypothetical protein